jgi:uroporphyrinogen-III synthase
MNRLVAVLRPEPGASATARRLHAAGLEPLVVPLFTIAAIDDRLPDDGNPQALMITSAHAVRHGADVIRQHPGLPIYTVGKASAAALRPLVTAPIHIAPEGNAPSLIACATSHGVTRVLHISGEDVRPVDAPNISITRQIVYRAAPVAAVPDALIKSWSQLAIIMVHSPRAAAVLDQLTALAGLARDHVALVAISPAAAQAAASGWNDVHIAARPDDEAMLAVACQLCQKGADDGGTTA